MASSDGKSQGDGTENSAYCDFCKDEGLNENAFGFCSSCWKYICSGCEKGHGKFNPNHKLKKGADMPKQDVVKSTFPCKIHTNYAVDLYCDEHGSVFCSLCKCLKHDSCKVQKIEEVVEEMNVK